MRIPNALVYLGRAVELDCDTYKWTWSKKDNFGLYCNPEGGTLYILPDRKGKRAYPFTSKQIVSGKAKYKRFHLKKSDKIETRMISNKPLKRIGSGLHVIYESNKWHRSKKKYIHDFESKPAVYCDRANQPQQLAIRGGIKITKKGIEG